MLADFAFQAPSRHVGQATLNKLPGGASVRLARTLAPPTEMELGTRNLEPGTVVLMLTILSIIPVS